MVHGRRHRAAVRRPPFRPRPRRRRGPARSSRRCWSGSTVAAARRQLLGDVAQLRPATPPASCPAGVTCANSPHSRISRSRWRKTMPSCLTRSRRLDVLVEVAAEAQQLARRPDRLRVHVGHLGIVRVEQQPQLLGQRRRPLVASRRRRRPPRPRSGGGGGERSGRGGSAPVEPRRRQRAGRQLVRPRHAHVTAAAAAASPARSRAPAAARRGRRCRGGRAGTRRRADGRCGRRAACPAPASAWPASAAYGVGGGHRRDRWLVPRLRSASAAAAGRASRSRRAPASAASGRGASRRP